MQSIIFQQVLNMFIVWVKNDSFVYIHITNIYSTLEQGAGKAKKKDKKASGTDIEGQILELQNPTAITSSFNPTAKMQVT